LGAPLLGAPQGIRVYAGTVYTYRKRHDFETWLHLKKKKQQGRRQQTKKKKKKKKKTKTKKKKNNNHNNNIRY